MSGTEASVAGEQAVDLAVGQKIRALRQAKGWRLETVAAKAGLSVGFISQIERGLSSPSLRALTALADVLGVSLSAFFDAKDTMSPADAVVTREGERAELRLWRSGISKQLLSPAAPGGLSLFLVHLQPGASTGDELYTHDGEEAGLVLDGAMTLTVDRETWTLRAGDSFRFASRRPHRFGNPSRDEEARVLWVNSLNGRSS